MKDENEYEFEYGPEVKILKELTHKFQNHETLSKKEKAKAESIDKRIILRGIWHGNPNLKALETANDEKLLSYLKELEFISEEEQVWDREFYEFIKNEKGFNTAKKLMILAIKLEFDNYFKDKRFKTPPNFEEFITEIKLLQHHYPKLKSKKDRRQKLLRALSTKWLRETEKPEPIHVIKGLFKKLYTNEEPVTEKGLSKVRTKIKRAKQRGFL